VVLAVGPASDRCRATRRLAAQAGRTEIERDLIWRISARHSQVNDAIWLKRLAAAAIAAQLLALVRTLSEVFRIKHFAPDQYTLVHIEPFVGAALFTSVFVAVAIVPFAVGRYRTALTLAVVNIVALFVYKVIFM
jgi:hypothetical protein